MTGLAPELRDRIERLARAGHVLIAMDFDGTLAPFVDVPDEARPLKASARAMAELQDMEDTDLALVSGRGLDSLRLVASPGDRTLLVGSHGAERYAPPEFQADEEQAQLTPAQAQLLVEVLAALNDVAQAYPEVWVEAKPAGAVMHTRRASAQDGPAAIRAGDVALDRLAGVTVTPGKNVLEAAVLPADKGQGLNWAREVSDASAVVFAGDDRTDEDAFAVLGPQDVGIKVGPGPTKAKFRVDGPGDVAELLQLLVDVRG